MSPNEQHLGYRPSRIRGSDDFQQLPRICKRRLEVKDALLLVALRD